jgi:hypothetical protein
MIFTPKGQTNGLFFFPPQKPQSVLTLDLRQVRMSILLRLSTLFLLAFSVLLSTVSARPQVNNVYKRKASPTGTEKYLTNAARMAAGLGPLAPRNPFNPTRVKGVLLSPIHVPFLSIMSNQLLEMQIRLSLRE